MPHDLVELPAPPPVLIYPVILNHTSMHRDSKNSSTLLKESVEAPEGHGSIVGGTCTAVGAEFKTLGALRGTAHIKHTTRNLSSLNRPVPSSLPAPLAVERGCGVRG